MSIDVLHVVPAFFPTRGGIEVLVENLTQALNVSSGLTHGVLSPRVDGERPDDYLHGNTRVWSVDAPHPNSLRQYYEGIEIIPQESIDFARILRDTRRHIKEIQPTIVHLHGFSLVGSAAAAIAEAWGIPMVMHVHGSVDGGLSVRMRRQLTRSDFTIAVSEYVASSIERETHRTDGVVIVRNGLADPMSDQAIHAPSENRISITMVGRLEATKGFDVGLKAVARIIEEFPAMTVNIVGVGVEQNSLANLACELGLEREVVFWGRLDRPDVLEKIRDSTCVVVPSIDLEGFSLVALESALLERPVVASRVGGLPETVIDGQTGTVVDPLSVDQLAEALRTYFSTPALASQHGRNARERALREFTLERTVLQVQAIHGQVMDRISRERVTTKSAHSLDLNT